MARGPVVNNADLYEALVAGEIQAAGLDVLEKEPLELSNPLSKLKDSNKLIITPHLAWASVEARTRCVQGVYENIKAFYARREPECSESVRITKAACQRSNRVSGEM